jgi:hypothetical protein
MSASLRNRLIVATAMWREATSEPLPKLEAGDPAHQIEQFEIAVMDLLFENASAANAREVAEKTWDVVHDRPDSDPVKKRVTEIHEHLARISAAAP